MDEVFVVAEFFRLYMADRRAGTVRPLGQYQEPFPGFEAVIAAEYHALGLADSPAEATEVSGGAPAGGLTAIGRYRILKEIGHGGQGTVFLAADPALGRNVALKVLSRLGGAADTTLARFQREALVASRLNHPGICKVYESGREGGFAYIAMEFVEGETLAGRVARQREEVGVPAPRRDPESSTRSHTSKQSVRAILEIGERAAQALHAAHEAGVVHRDVKPGNIVVADDNQPVILDFGLARATEGEFRTLTRTGDFFGTPAYMSPEQVSTRSGRPDRRTDVYALAATLYECLTLRPPFGRAGSESLYQRILTETAPRPSRFNRCVSRDLDLVLAKAMDKEPRRRYASALDFAEELRRVRRFEPIRARAPGPVLRMRRWSQRNPVAAAFLLLLALGLAGALFLLNRVRTELQHARALGLVRESILAMESDPTLGLLLAREAVRSEERAETVSQLQSAVARSVAVARIPHDDRVSMAEFSRDGMRVVTASNDGSAKVWRRDGDCWKPGPILRHEGLLTRACFFPVGGNILTVCRNGTLTVWDATGASLTTFGVAGRQWCRAILAPDGNHVLSLDGSRGTLWGRRGLQWEIEREFRHPKPIWNASFSHDGRRVVIGEGHQGLDDRRTWSPRALIWDIQGERCVKLKGHDQTIRTAVFSPDDRLVLTTSRDGTARLWDANDGRCLATLRHDGWVLSGCFFPDGKRIVTGGHDGKARVWGSDGNLESICVAYGPVRHVAVSPDGTKILTCSQGNRARLFDRAGREIALLLGHKFTVFHGAFAPTGVHMVTTSADHSAIVWRVDWPDYPVLRGHRGMVTQVRFIQEGKIIETRSMGGALRSWDRGGIERADWRPEPDGSRLVVRTINSRKKPAVLIVDGQGRVAASFSHVARVSTARLSPDQTRLVTITQRGEEWRIWDVRNGALVVERRVAGARFRDAEFSPDGRRILTAAADGSLQVWDATEARELIRIICPYMIHRGHFSPDGRLAVTASHDGAVLWDLEGEKVLAVLRAHAGSVTDAIFSPEGDKVLTASIDGTVRTWPVHTSDLMEAADRRAFRGFTPQERERFAGLLDE